MKYPLSRGRAVKLAPQDAGTTLLIVPTYQQATKEEEKEKKKEVSYPRE